MSVPPFMQPYVVGACFLSLGAIIENEYVPRRLSRDARRHGVPYLFPAQP